MSGRAILNALIAGETDPDRLVDLTRGRLKATRADLVDALHGRVTDHHRLIKLHLTQIEALQAAVATIEARIGEALGPFRAAVSLLTTMPGLSATTARVLIAEIGTDMSRFPSVGHLISWAGFCPRLDESAGKRRSTHAADHPLAQTHVDQLRPVTSISDAVPSRDFRDAARRTRRT